MDIIAIITAILTLVAGIGVFLIACTTMSSNLESASSKRLKRLFAKTGDNKWLGVAIGTVGTAAIQSSGAVTVMVIGFVNVGIMSLAQAATIIYGANIGTTVTACGYRRVHHALYQKRRMETSRRSAHGLRNAVCRSEYDVKRDG